LIYISNTGISGSNPQLGVGFQAFAGAVSETVNPAQSSCQISVGTNQIVYAEASADPFTSDSDLVPLIGYTTATVNVGDTLTFIGSATGVSSAQWSFKKNINGVETLLFDQDTGSVYAYTVTAADLSNPPAYFIANSQGESV